MTAPSLIAGRDTLIHMIEQSFLARLRGECVRRGEFILASGRKSSYYLDVRPFLLSAEGNSNAGVLLFDKTRDLEIDAVGGLESGSIAPTIAMTLVHGKMNHGVRGFFVRKQHKGHGTGDLIVGEVNPCDRVLIVDDVMTTGESVMKAIQAVVDAGADVVGVACIVDRLGGTKEMLAGYDYRPLFTIRDLGIEPDGE